MFQQVEVQVEVARSKRRTQAGRRGNASSKANICGVCLKRKKKKTACVSSSVSFIFPAREAEEVLLCFFVLFPSPLETSLSERRPPRSTPASATGGKWQRGKKTGERGAESACLSGLMMQSARNTPPILPKSPSLPPSRPLQAMTSPPWEATWQRTLAGPHAVAGNFFRQQLRYFKLSHRQHGENVSKISDFMCCNSLIMAETVEANDENTVITAACEGGRPDVMWSRQTAMISGFYFKRRMH